VAKNAYPYPPDEFDQVDLTSRPKEVHAARRGAWSRTWPFLLVIVLIPAIAFAVVLFLGNRLGEPSTKSPPPSGPTDTASDQPSDTQSEEPPAEPSPEPTEEEPAPVVDKAATVTVFNISGVNLCAADAVGELTTAGYTAAATKKEGEPATPAATTVYYSTEDQAATAQDIATTLGVAAPQLDATVGGGSIVVIVAEKLPYCDGK
jgi:cytoskeletal protein RodZ